MTFHTTSNLGKKPSSILDGAKEATALKKPTAPNFPHYPLDFLIAPERYHPIFNH